MVSQSPGHPIFNPFMDVDVSNLGKAVSGEKRNIWRGAEHSLVADL